MKTFFRIASAGLLLGACHAARTPLPPAARAAAYYEPKAPTSPERVPPARSVLVGIRDGLALTATFYLLGPRQDTAGRPAFRYRVRLLLQNWNDHAVVFAQPLRLAVPLRDTPRVAYATFPALSLPVGGETEAYYELTLRAGQPLPKPRFQLNGAPPRAAPASGGRNR